MNPNTKFKLGDFVQFKHFESIQREITEVRDTGYTTKCSRGDLHRTEASGDPFLDEWHVVWRLHSTVTPTQSVDVTMTGFPGKVLLVDEIFVDVDEDPQKDDTAEYDAALRRSFNLPWHVQHDDEVWCEETNLHICQAVDENAAKMIVEQHNFMISRFSTKGEVPYTFFPDDNLARCYSV